MTLIQVTHADGSRERCDARCHHAKRRTCTCCCGGMNHGVGPEKAALNTAAMAAALLGDGKWVNPRVLQGAVPGATVGSP